MEIFVKNIKGLVNVREVAPESPLKGLEMNQLPVLEDAYLIISDGKIYTYGLMADLDRLQSASLETCVDEVIDATGKFVFPSFCDSHTHLVYAGSREQEYMDKIRGLSYQDIAKRGGGILNSVELLHNTSEDELFAQSLCRAEEIIGFGTGAVEIKSGYGLTLEDEIKMLRVAKRIGAETPLTVKTTFLGAHAIPARYKGNKAAYVDEIINEMIPVIASEELAEYVDIFVEEGFFEVEDAERIFMAGLKYGLLPTVHANQLSVSGGVQVGVKYGAVSVAHLEYTGEAEFEALSNSETIATLLPGSSFFMEMDFAPAKKMLEYNLPLALATNYNPGSSPYGDMKFMMGLACLKCKLNPELAINAATLNGAFAMGLGEELGSITEGKVANVFVTKEMSSYEFMPYAFSTPLIDKVILNGKIIK